MLAAGNHHLLSKVVILTLSEVERGRIPVFRSGLNGSRARRKLAGLAQLVLVATLGRHAGGNHRIGTRTLHLCFRFYRDRHGFGGPDPLPESGSAGVTSVGGPIVTLTENSRHPE